MPPSWSEWQANFVELIVDPARDGSASLGLAARGLAVYRNNYRVGLIGVLVHTYPVLEQLVGNDFLTGLAREYVKREPLRSGNVHHYGASFGDFLDGFEPARALPYLADVARVEWSAHRAYYAEDAEPLSPETLTEDPSASPPLHFDPSVSLVRSPWPVVATWQAHQPGSPEDFYIDLGQGGEDAAHPAKGRPGHRGSHTERHRNAAGAPTGRRFPDDRERGGTRRRRDVRSASREGTPFQWRGDPSQPVASLHHKPSRTPYRD